MITGRPPTREEQEKLHRVYTFGAWTSPILGLSYLALAAYGYFWARHQDHALVVFNIVFGIVWLVLGWAHWMKLRRIAIDREFST